MYKVIALLTLIFFQNSYAEIVQILHTNDLHSHFKRYNMLDDVGGYARLKSLIDKEKAKALKKGIKTIVVDGGDFSEGTAYYMSDLARKSFKVLDMIGYDVVALGNHDYLMGMEDLNNILEDVKPKYLLAALNITIPKKFEAARESIGPYRIFEIGDKKIAILGIGNSDPWYTWRIGEGRMLSYHKRTRRYLKSLKRKGVNSVVALTHIGLHKDMFLAARVKGLDLIIGGHTHTTLMKPKWVRGTPIVQAGSHARWLGKIFMDIKKNGAKLVSYELLPVEGEEKDPEIERFVEEAQDDLYDIYGQEWLDEILGVSELPPLKPLDSVGTRLKKREVWMDFITDSLREASNADFALHAAPLSGWNYPVGVVTRQDLINANPRFFELSDIDGWNVYSARIPGFLIKLFFEVLTRFDLPLYITGASFDYNKIGPSQYEVSNVRVKRKKISPFKTYRVGLSEGIIRAGFSLTKYVRLILKNVKKTPVPIWEALENRLKKLGGIKKRKRGDNQREVDHMTFLPDSAVY